MKKDTIVQFVCFETSVASEEFISQWEQYSSKLSKEQDVTLQQETGRKGKLRFVSQHRCHANDFSFIFKKGKRATLNPEVEMRIKEAGGFIPLQVQYEDETDADECKVLVFANLADTDLEFYRTMPGYHYLNIYQAYYESCLFSHVLEFFAKTGEATEITEQIKAHNRAIDAAMYKECIVLTK